MTTHELREAVLTSSSAEARARHFVERRLIEARDSLGNRQAGFFLQSMPLISPEPPWDVFSTPFENVIRGDVRRNTYRHYANLASDVAPRPTIDGLMGQDHRDPTTWQTEVHRTGYFSLLYRNIQTERIGDVDRFVLHSGTCDIFHAFCHMLKDFLDVSGTDVPYLLACTYFNSAGTCIWTDSRWAKFSEPYRKNEIVWPEHFRQTGADPMTIAGKLCVEMFNAFGFKAIAS
jgi:hypothetical protein